MEVMWCIWSKEEGNDAREIPWSLEVLEDESIFWTSSINCERWSSLQSMVPEKTTYAKIEEMDDFQWRFLLLFS